MGLRDGSALKLAAEADDILLGHQQAEVEGAGGEGRVGVQHVVQAGDGREDGRRAVLQRVGGEAGLLLERVRGPGDGLRGVAMGGAVAEAAPGLLGAEPLAALRQPGEQRVPLRAERQDQPHGPLQLLLPPAARLDPAPLLAARAPAHRARLRRGEGLLRPALRVQACGTTTNTRCTRATGACFTGSGTTERPCRASLP